MIMATTSLRMPDELLVRLEATAGQMRRSKGWVIKDALEEYLKREELKQKRDQQTLSALADFDAGRLVDGEEVMSWLESWGGEDEQPAPVI